MLEACRSRRLHRNRRSQFHHITERSDCPDAGSSQTQHGGSDIDRWNLAEHQEREMKEVTEQPGHETAEQSASRAADSDTNDRYSENEFEVMDCDGEIAVAEGL